jgi:hypothetical protein
MVYSVPRYTSLCPRWRPKPRDSVSVNPAPPALSTASFTSSTLNGFTSAVTSLIRSLLLRSASSPARALGQ